MGRLQKRDLKSALDWFGRARGNDHQAVAQSEASFLEAWCFERGHGVEEDLARAAELYAFGASHHLALAEAWCELNGAPELNTSKVAPLAVYMDEAMDGWSDCARLIRPFLLGECHEYGRCGLERDAKAALGYYRVAAARGLIDAERKLEKQNF